jgi:hypothetical protein
MEITRGGPRNSGVDDGNSSTTNLTAATSLVFTGEWQDISSYSSTSVLVDGTAASTTSGTLEMQFSHDGVTVHRNISVPTADVADTLPRTLGTVAQYFRVIYTSDGDLTSFVIQTMLHNSQVDLISRMSQTIQGTEDVLLVRDPTEFDLDAARKHIVGQRSDFFFGNNNSLQNGVFEDVWNGGGDIPWQTAAAKVKVVSSNAADDATGPGIGLQSVEIHGLDANGADIEEILELNGVTPVESALSYLRVSLVHNQEVGTYGGSHEGDITVRVTNPTFGNGDLVAVMSGREGNVNVSPQYGMGEAENGFTSVPLGKVMYITRLEVVPKTAKPITIILYEREGITTTSDPFLPRRALWIIEEVIDPVLKEFKTHIKIKSLADIWFRAEGNGQVSGVAVWLDYYLVDADAAGA